MSKTNKIIRTKSADIIEYRGDSIRMEKYDNQDEISIWVTNRGQMPAFGRLDLDSKALKELCEVLPEFIKSVDK